jgi:hypothetical protein
MNMRQIEREPTVKSYMDMVYIPETQTLTLNGWYSKRGPDNESEEQPEAKRGRYDSALVDMLIYMKEQVELAQKMSDELYPM